MQRKRDAAMRPPTWSVMVEASVIIQGEELVRVSDARPIGRLLPAANALDESTWPAALARGEGLIVVRTGFEAGTSEPSPLWLPGPREQWGRFAAHIQKLCESAGVTPVVWPRLRDVLSDAPGLLSFLRGAPAWRFVVEPLALLTPEMRRNAPEHVARLGELLFAHHACAGVLVRSRISGADGFSEHPALQADLATMLEALAKSLREAPSSKKCDLWVQRGDEGVVQRL
jgi:hypothetical protein